MEKVIVATRDALKKRGLESILVGPRELAYWGASGNFRLSTLPGNSRVVVSHAVWLPEEKRGQGLGKKLLRTRLTALREAGAKLMLSTVKNSNRREIHLLRQRGFRRLIRFGSTSLWGKAL